MACILITICWYILRALCSEVKFPLEGKTHRPAFFFLFNIYFNSMYGNFIYTPHVCLPEEGVKSFGTGVTDGCEPWYGFWGLNLGSLQEQQVLLSPEPSLQPQVWLSWGKIFFKKRSGQPVPLYAQALFPLPLFYIFTLHSTAPTPLLWEGGGAPWALPYPGQRIHLEAFFEETEESPPGLESCYLCYPVRPVLGTERAGKTFAVGCGL